MVSFLLATVLVFRDSIVNVPAGYYTLGELSSVLAKEGFAVTVDAGCDADVYALRVINVSFSDFAKALEQDGRLQASQDGSNLSLRRSDSDRVAQRNQADKYIGSARDAISHVYGTAYKRTNDMMARSADYRTKAIPALTATNGKTASQRVSDELVYRVAGVGALPYYDLAVPAMLSDSSSRDPFGRPRTTTMADSPNLFAFGGNLRSVPMLGPRTARATDRALLNIARSEHLSAKLVLEPLTMTTVSRTVIFPYETLLSELARLPLASPRVITPDMVPVTVKPEQIFSPDELRAQAERVKATTALLQSGSLGGKVPAGDGAGPVSRFALRWAVKGGSNLVEYVAPVSELRLAGTEEWSLAKGISDLNAGRVDPSSRLEMIKEAGAAMSVANSGLPPMVRLTVARSGPILVVRDEMRFLDEMVAGRNCGLPTDFGNARFRGRLPGVVEFVRSVAKMSPSRWGGSRLGSAWFEFANPASFYPFATVLNIDKDLRKQVAALEEVKPISVTMGQLGSIEESELRQAVYDCADFNDAVSQPPTVDPMIVKAFIREPSVSLDLTLARQGNLVRFDLSHSGKLLWSSWMRNVEG